MTAQSKYSHIWTKWKMFQIEHLCSGTRVTRSLLGQDNCWQFFYPIGRLWLGGGLLLCTIRGRLLDCKPTFYLQSNGGSGCKRVVCTNNTPIKVAALPVNNPPTHQFLSLHCDNSELAAICRICEYPDTCNSSRSA